MRNELEMPNRQRKRHAIVGQLSLVLINSLLLACVFSAAAQYNYGSGPITLWYDIYEACAAATFVGAVFVVVTWNSLLEPRSSLR